MNAPLPPVQTLTPKDAVALGATSLVLFGKLFFPKTFRQGSPLFHQEMGLHLMGPARYNAFKVFRGGAKTTFLRVYTAQRLAYDISRTIMFVSVSQPHSIMSLRWLKRQIERNSGFATAFGLAPGDKWSDEWLEVRHTLTGTVATVLAVGITGQIRGFNIDDHRPDLIVGDDLCNEENTATIEQRTKISNLWFGALLNSLAPTSESPLAKMALLQTPLAPDDLLDVCAKDPAWNTLTYGTFDDNGESRWPERWSTQELRTEKESFARLGKFAVWMREKECKIVTGEHMPFDVANLQYYDTPPEGGVTIVAIDPASSDAPDADDLAIVALRIVGQQIYVLESFADKGVMPDAVLAKFFEMVWKYNPLKGVVETISYQKMLAWYMKNEMARRRLYIPIEEIKDKRAKEDRILQALQQVVAFKNLFVRRGDLGLPKLIDQITNFSPGFKGKDDVIDALAMGVTSVNPALRFYSGNELLSGEVIPGQGSMLPPLRNFRGCP